MKCLNSEKLETIKGWHKHKFLLKGFDVSTNLLQLPLITVFIDELVNKIGNSQTKPKPQDKWENCNYRSDPHRDSESRWRLSV